MSDFLTLEDVDGALFTNQGFFWVEIDTALIGDTDFSNVKMDFCTVSRETGSFSGKTYRYTFIINNPLWTTGIYSNAYGTISTITDGFKFDTNASTVKMLLYMGNEKYENILGVESMEYHLKDDSPLNLNYKELNTSQDIIVVNSENHSERVVSKVLDVGYNQIKYYSFECGFLLVNLIKSDFQFTCNQDLTVGKVNKVALGTDSDYLHNGDMIGANTPSIHVEYKDEIIPVIWDSDSNDYCFNLDLSDKTNEGTVGFKVIVKANDVINRTETDVRLTASYPTISTLSNLTALFNAGGIGVLGSNLTLTDDLVLRNDILLIGNDKTLNLNSHKIIVPSSKSIKANNITFSNGLNTIQQSINSKVELNNCTFTDCTGLGSVIDCQIDIENLDNPNDFTTILNNCEITNCDTAILHGGDLTVKDCTITGKIGNKDYPYFLYQTDGNATLTGNQFRISSNTQIATDIEYNSCIFICGENATINGNNHQDWQNNNISSFLDDNTSSIDLTYYYTPITDYIHLLSNRGYCYAVSGVDYVFKANVSIERS